VKREGIARKNKPRLLQTLMPEFCDCHQCAGVTCGKNFKKVCATRISGSIREELQKDAGETGNLIPGRLRILPRIS
jgi:hypothetical protein